ncbi:MAG: SIS domain-containing protein, partial [Tissierellia bacterium]|nr:SIS domain-containing protein [Tissierellia bacterium]
MYKEYILKNMEALNNLDCLESKHENIVELIVECLKNKKKIMLVGNGGSAADSMHIAAEFVSRFKLERNPFQAISLSSNQSIITAISNDYGYDYIFSKQILAYGEEGDILIALSTSGNSKNILKAINEASIRGITTILLTGNSKVQADINVCFLSNETDIIQNMYIIFLHSVCEKVERVMINENSI